MIGKTISHYKIIENIGCGGMGIVYKAQDLKLDRFVALKFLPPHLTTSEEEKQRFIHEAKAASSLDYNNICAIYEIDETKPAPGEPGEGQLFISMAYYEGETLDKRIKDKPLPFEKANDIAIQIAQGLAKAHEKEIVHRDIKPANIMLTKEGVVKVLDFGLAKLSTQTKLTKESTTLGTVSYMSPEQAKGEDVDYRTDIWSLGVIIYEMLTGQLPFKGEYESAVIYSIMNDTQEPVTALRTGVPLELERIVNKCLQKNPADRYQHIDELIVDLQGIKRQSESTGIPSKEEKQKKRSKSVLLPIAILSIVILIIAGYFLITSGEKSTSEWENSIAVLPFADLSPNKDQEYFCDGMTEQIITNLSKINRLKVIGRTSVMKFKNTEKTLPEIGKELNVSHILEGSIRKYSNSIRVTAQLINTEDGFHIWADDFDRELEHVFEVQDDVSQAIASNLIATLSPQEKIKIKTNRPSNTEAYEYYMKGRYFHLIKFFYSLSKEDFLTSEKMFKAAIKLDPNFADSYASLADLYNTYYYSLPDTGSEKRKNMQLQEAYLDTAYQLDPNSAEVLFTKSNVQWCKNEVDDAIASVKKAILKNKNHNMAYFVLGVYLQKLGIVDLAIKYYTKAIELNPLSYHNYVWRSRLFYDIGEFKKAEIDIEKALEIESNIRFNFFYRNYLLLLITLKKYDNTEKLLIQLEKTHPEWEFHGFWSIIYTIKGEKKRALEVLKKCTWNFPTPYIFLGLKEEAINIIEKIYRDEPRLRSYWYIHSKACPFYDSIRNDSRFQKILQKTKKIYEANLKKYGDIEELID
jgi:non-specific serine/threonine protein kinase